MAAEPLSSDEEYADISTKRSALNVRFCHIVGASVDVTKSVDEAVMSAFDSCGHAAELAIVQVVLTTNALTSNRLSHPP
jgi:hypothetical protein